MFRLVVQHHFLITAHRKRYWMSFRRHDLFNGTKHTYDDANKRWQTEPVKLKLSWRPFALGVKRNVYRAEEVRDDGTIVECVIKSLRDESGATVNSSYDEVVTQTVAGTFAKEFNALCAKRGLLHRISFLPASAVLLDSSPTPFRVEPYLPGKYTRYSDAHGRVISENQVAHAFAYFSYLVSDHRLVICDLQGMEGCLTSPKINTFDGVDFGGNLGADAMEHFLEEFSYSDLCSDMELPLPRPQAQAVHRANRTGKVESAPVEQPSHFEDLPSEPVHWTETFGTHVKEMKHIVNNVFTVKVSCVGCTGPLDFCDADESQLKSFPIS